MKFVSQGNMFVANLLAAALFPSAVAGQNEASWPPTPNPSPIDSEAPSNLVGIIVITAILSMLLGVACYVLCNDNGEDGPRRIILRSKDGRKTGDTVEFFDTEQGKIQKRRLRHGERTRSPLKKKKKKSSAGSGKGDFIDDSPARKTFVEEWVKEAELVKQQQVVEKGKSTHSPSQSADSTVNEV